jgi:ribonuclease VapC
MIVDTSALIAILRKEQGYQSLIETLLKTDRVRISAATLLESRMVANRDNGLSELAELLAILDAEIIAVDEPQADIAFQGFLRYGKGRHPAGAERPQFRGATPLERCRERASTKSRRGGRKISAKASEGHRPPSALTIAMATSDRPGP